MSLPNIIYGMFGDEKVAQSTKIGNNSLGQLMILPDGRKFRLAKAGGTNLSAGVVVSCSAGSAGHGNAAGSGLIASATTTRNQIGDTDVYVATSLAAFTADQFAEGYMNVQGPAASTYQGHVYRVKGNDLAASVAAAGDLHIRLHPDDPLKVAFKAGTTTVSLRKNPFGNCVIAASAGAAGPVVGTTPVAVSANYYFWAQRTGPASVQTTGTTVTDGAPVVIGDTEAGSCTLEIAASLAAQPFIGQALETVTAAEAALIDLRLE